MDESYGPSTTDFGPIVNKVISSNADAAGAPEVEQKANLNCISILVAPADDKFARLGPAALGVTVPSQWEPQVPYTPQFGPTTAEFVKNFEAKFHQKADYPASG